MPVPNFPEFLPYGQAVKARFESFLIKGSQSEDCWIWNGTKTKTGSCLFWFIDNNRMARDVSYLLYKNDKHDSESKIRSICGNKNCVNPDHLFKMTLEDRFIRYVRKTAGCWFWEGSYGTTGYGEFSVNGYAKKAHRVSYELFNGKITSDKPVVCHSCDNPRCVNPDHLWAGTYADNMIDKYWKGRGNNTYGDLHHSSKLSENQVLAIREEYIPGEFGSRRLARKYNVSKQAIESILKRKTWKMAGKEGAVR